MYGDGFGQALKILAVLIFVAGAAVAALLFWIF